MSITFKEQARLYPCWILVERSTNLPGQWIAHCLDYDIVSQGNSASHAIDMVSQAVGICLSDDLDTAGDLTDRPLAPETDRKRLIAILQDPFCQNDPGKSSTVDHLASGTDLPLVVRLNARFSLVDDRWVAHESKLLSIHSVPRTAPPRSERSI